MTVPLPPLPPAPGEDDESYRPGGRSVLAVLREEHARISRLCGELTDATLDGPRRAEVAQVLTATVARHLSAEEQYLYPTVAAAVPGGESLAEREIAADVTILRTLRELTAHRPGEAAFEERAVELAGQLDRHARAVAGELFPPLDEVATDAELIRLGNRVEIAEEAAPTRPHPDTPSAPPWNRVVDPVVGVVDKVRDVVAGRSTRLEDLGVPPRT